MTAGGANTAPGGRRPSGHDLVASVARAFTMTMVVSNAVGAVIVAVFLTLVLQEPHPPPLNQIVLTNWPAVIGYLAVGAFVAPRWGRAIALSRLTWLLEDREPTADEQRAILRNPLAQLKVVAAGWVLAAVLFATINLHFSTEIAANVGTGILIGGVVTIAISYILGERAMRPVTARALECGVPMNPVAPGVVVRTMLAWLCAAAIPLVAVADVAVGMINGNTPRTVATAWSLIFLTVVGLIAGAVALLFTAKSIAEPIQSVRAALRQVEQGRTDVEVEVDDASEIGLLQAGFNRMAAGLRERERLRDLFGRHVGEDVARRALEAGVELGGELREAAVLFVDVIDSTGLTASTAPHDVVAALNRFFGLVSAVTAEHGGWVNKFEGDAALCIFGVPNPIEDAAGRALAAARELAATLEREGTLSAGVGVSAGQVVAGNVGAAERFEYTVIGDPVNEAARLTELAKAQRPRVLASAAAVRRAGDREAAHWQAGEDVTLRGRSEPTATATPVVSRAMAAS